MTDGHAGEQDKGGAPYTLHPLRMILGSLNQRCERSDKNRANLRARCQVDYCLWYSWVETKY